MAVDGNLSEHVTVRMTPGDLARLGQVACLLGSTPSGLLRAAARLVGRAVPDPEPTLGLCLVCETPRRAEPVEDRLAHVQCDQISAGIEKELSA